MNGDCFRNEVIRNIAARRSVRRFTDGRIPEEDIRILGEAAVNAPSGMNRQEWKFVFIRNRDKIKLLADAVGKAMSREGYDFYRPDCLMIASARSLRNLSAADCACALENVFLAAASLGIGSVWINQLCDAQQDGNVKKMLTELGVPEDYTVYGAASLGYPDDSGEKKARKDGCVLIVD